jgi:hypothetical protein
MIAECRNSYRYQPISGARSKRSFTGVGCHETYRAGAACGFRNSHGFEILGERDRGDNGQDRDA